MPTPRKLTPKVLKEWATKLHSRVIRYEGRCRHCGTTDYDRLQCAHIIGRSYSVTRVRLDNAYCLCAKCHQRFTYHPDEWMTFVDETIGRDEYDRLKQLAEAGITAFKINWQDELDELVMICEWYGISTHKTANNRMVAA